MFKKIMSVLLIAVLMASFIGCAKSEVSSGAVSEATNGEANEIAVDFTNEIAGGKAYKGTHNYLEYNETLEVNKDSKGNYKVIYNYDNQIDEVYKIGTEYSIYINGELDTEYYSNEELKEMVDAAIEDIEFYPTDSLEVFDLDIDSDTKKANGKDGYLVSGIYDDNTEYEYYYNSDGSYFELTDDYDVVRIDLDDTIIVELP